jgi:phenylacetate-coenzyme A ligase PaaK-like adenylate-forming protein
MSTEAAFQKQIYDFLMESQYLSAAEIVQYQQNQLSQLLKFAFAKVPFYKDRLKPVMGTGGQIRWDRWSEIPILTRSDLLTHREAMLAPEVPAGHGNWSDHEGTGDNRFPGDNPP